MYLQSKVTITSTLEVMTTAYKEVFSNNYSLIISTIIEKYILQIQAFYDIIDLYIHFNYILLHAEMQNRVLHPAYPAIAELCSDYDL